MDWEALHSPQTKVKGRVFFNDEDLASAFGLYDSSGLYGDWLIKRFGANLAEQGRYIR